MHNVQFARHHPARKLGHSRSTRRYARIHSPRTRAGSRSGETRLRCCLCRASDPGPDTAGNRSPGRPGVGGHRRSSARSLSTGIPLLAEGKLAEEERCAVGADRVVRPAKCTADLLLRLRPVGLALRAAPPLRGGE